jgi:hypothetical protein
MNRKLLLLGGLLALSLGVFAQPTVVGPVTVSPGLPGGTSANLQLIATGVVKSSPGILMRIVVIAPGTSGSLVLNDNNSLLAVVSSTFTNGSASITGANVFAVGQTVVLSGTVPLPYLVNTTYYVSATGLTAAYYQLSTTLTGTPANVTGTTGTVTVTPAVTSTFTNGSATITAANNFTAGTQVILTGTVPLPYLTSTQYFVSAQNLTSKGFQLSQTPQGTPAAVTGTTGTVTVTNALNTVANEIITIPFGSLAVGQVIWLEWPCGTGITISAIPGGSPQFSLSFT